MRGLVPTNMFPSTEKDRANVLESRPNTPLTPLSKTPFHLHLRLSLSHLTLLLSHCFFFFISHCLYLLPPLSATLISRPLFPSSPLLAFPSLSPSLLLLPGAVVIFPHLRLIPKSRGMYGFICMAPAFYWIPIALEQGYHIPNSSRANLIQNS